MKSLDRSATDGKLGVIGICRSPLSRNYVLAVSVVLFLGVLLTPRGNLKAQPTPILKGDLEWDGPCGKKADGSSGGKVCGFQIRVYNGDKDLLGERFIAVLADDPQGCAHYQTNIIDLLPQPGSAVNAPPLVTVASIDCEGLSSLPARVYADLFCPAKVLNNTGDANIDGKLDISDAILLLTYFFKGGQRPCFNSADFNKDLKIDLSDPIAILNFQFLGKLP